MATLQAGFPAIVAARRPKATGKPARWPSSADRNCLDRHRLGHLLLDDLQEMEAFFLGLKVCELFFGYGPLVIVEDGDLFHAGVENAPARTHAGRRPCPWLFASGAEPRRRQLLLPYPYPYPPFRPPPRDPPALVTPVDSGF